MTKKSSMAGLLAPKGAAAPADDEAPVAPAPQKRVQVAVPSPRQPEPAPVLGSPKNLSVKLDEPRYRDLRLMAVDTGLSHQQLMVMAFDDLHRRFKAGELSW